MDEYDLFQMRKSQQDVYKGKFSINPLGFSERIKSKWIKASCFKVSLVLQSCASWKGRPLLAYKSGNTQDKGTANYCEERMKGNYGICAWICALHIHQQPEKQ